MSAETPLIGGAASAAIPLISAAIAALVAWLVTLRQGRTARHNWVLDKRFGVYKEVVEAFLAVVRRVHDLGTGGTLQQGLQDIEARGRLLAALTTLELLAPDRIRKMADRCIQLMWGVIEGTETGEEFIEELERLFALMREDLVPKQLR